MRLEDRLKKEYRVIFSNKNARPQWALRKNDGSSDLIHCTIPFVGMDYCNQDIKILVYAYADELNNYRNNKQANLNNDDIAINRHRYIFDNTFCDKKRFFGDVCCQPFNNGTMAIVAYYIYLKLTNSKTMSPKEFYEKISFTHFCKFSVDLQHLQSKDNYNNNAYAINELVASFPYVKADIEILEPDYIIMPESFFNALKEQWSSINKSVKVIPILQLTKSNIMNRINETKYPRVQENDLEYNLKEWYAHLDDKIISRRLTGSYKLQFLSIFRYLDNLMENGIEEIGVDDIQE